MPSSLPVRITGLIVAVGVLLMDGLYVAIVRSQPGPLSDQPWTAPFVGGYLLVMAACAALSSVIAPTRWRLGLLGACAGGLFVLGFLALFSVGLPLFLLGLLSLLTLIPILVRSGHRFDGWIAIAGGMAALVLLFSGFEVTQRIIACPPGAVSGEGSGFLTGSYSYTCQSGRASVTYDH